jgi:hypothetical protein
VNENIDFDKFNFYILRRYKVLEHIPTILKEGTGSLVEQELKNIESQAANLMAELDKVNPNLAKAIKAIAQTTAKGTFADSYWRQKVEAKFTEVMLAVTGIIDQAYEAKGAEEHSLES